MVANFNSVLVLSCNLDVVILIKSRKPRKRISMKYRHFVFVAKKLIKMNSRHIGIPECLLAVMIRLREVKK